MAMTEQGNHYELPVILTVSGDELDFSSALNKLSIAEYQGHPYQAIIFALYYLQETNNFSDTDTKKSGLPSALVALLDPNVVVDHIDSDKVQIVLNRYLKSNFWDVSLRLPFDKNMKLSDEKMKEILTLLGKYTSLSPEEYFNR